MVIGEAAFEALNARARTLTDEALRVIAPIFVLSPHPDDETLGCGGLIARASALGLETRIAFLTDGGASHPGSPTWPRKRLAAARREEGRLAVAALGGADPAFLGWRDAEPHAAGDDEWRRTLERLKDLAAGARSVFTPWPREAHCDHEAAATLGMALAEDLGARLFFFLVWGWGDAAVVDATGPWRLECPETIQARRRALACHRTQTTDMISDADGPFRLPEPVVGLVERAVEIFLEG